MTNGITLEEILEHANLSKALSRVEANRGAPGVDRMGTDELRDYISAHPHELTSAIIKGTYRPSPVLRVSIPKEEPGKFRELGIPTVRDRLVQQAIAQVLNRYYDLTFSDRSYGFRPGKSAQDAIMAVTAYAEEGYVWAVDMDLEKFFDKINHSKMVQILSERISDGRVISLIHRFLRADVQTDKGLETRDMGAPQGGPLSPILANILLDKLDKELEKRGLRFARYADDMIVLCKSKRAATRVFESLTRFIEKKLLLRVNRKKSKIVYVGNRELKFLGYGFAPLKGRIIPTVHFRSKAKFKDRIRKILHRNKGQRLDQFTSELRTYLSGWSNYFGLAAFLGWASAQRQHDEQRQHDDIQRVEDGRQDAVRPLEDAGRGGQELPADVGQAPHQHHPDDARHQRHDQNGSGPDSGGEEAVPGPAGGREFRIIHCCCPLSGRC